MQPDGTLCLPAITRGFDEFRDWAPGRSTDMNYLLAFTEVRREEGRPAWTVAVRTMKLTPDEGIHELALAVAFANEPGFSMEVTPANIESLVARSLSRKPEHLAERSLLSAFRSVTNLAMIRHFYAPVAEAIPGLALDRINPQHKHFRGTWHGRPFILKISGRQARLNVWADHNQDAAPAWHAHLSYPEPLPLWEQISGDAVEAVRTLFADIAPLIAPNTAAPPVEAMPDFRIG